MKNKGFTLLELLVVIGIIGILVALATASYSATQKQARDSRRKQDMVAIQNALEQYYSTNNYSYPVSCKDASGKLQGSWPVDPSTQSDYSILTCTTGSYCICAALEETTGTDFGPACSGKSKNGNGLPLYYCVGNLQ